ncbi:MAG: Deoxycytidine deaminase [Candidatus Woesebacteria bacterium GW2011_GWA1_37_8]|uniref:Deoxycytidine deaminase n=2 Tax=Candidatus Woeseibacteriota TaxID=1752722 RepID=A0A0G0L361_9BACT|nr:MAG: hypothetical protein US39_C0008G0050 [Microgenomates group bacterium GW2011_GWC1_37_12b]KKQ45652.1 MAG: Deoxycytidine deaminase [Candidatus Woesebacteria bacterium GW2011_GWA1_37_8]KKQ86418.1 MAG: Deoxycytidine deaminase [Candidatus Woesebacteria bacterium GW2011_GWB1_38_8b]
MPLGPKLLLKLVKETKLVENLSDRELTNPEGAGFDLRIGEVYEINGKGFLGIEERKTPDIKLVSKYDENKTKWITLKPGDYYLVKTIESVNLPKNIAGYFYTRGTLFRSGLLHGLSRTDPGYKGQLVTSLANVGPCTIKLELGSRFVHIQFEHIKGEGSMYRGQWQGGRVAANKKEKQV